MMPSDCRSERIESKANSSSSEKHQWGRRSALAPTPAQSVSRRGPGRGRWTGSTVDRGVAAAACHVRSAELDPFSRPEIKNIDTL